MLLLVDISQCCYTHTHTLALVHRFVCINGKRKNWNRHIYTVFVLVVWTNDGNIGRNSMCRTEIDTHQLKLQTITRALRFHMSVYSCVRWLMLLSVSVSTAVVLLRDIWALLLRCSVMCYCFCYCYKRRPVLFIVSAILEIFLS